MPESSDPRQNPEPREAIGGAIQNTTARRLGQTFIPLGLLCAVGVVQLTTRGLSDPGGVALVVGALLAGATTLAYGLRIVKTAFGVPRRAWMTGVRVASPLPALFALYVLGWRGLRELVRGGGLTAVLMAILFAGLGVWVLRCWMRVMEIERLARVMSSNMDEYGGPA